MGGGQRRDVGIAPYEGGAGGKPPAHGTPHQALRATFPSEGKAFYL